MVSFDWYLTLNFFNHQSVLCRTFNEASKELFTPKIEIQFMRCFHLQSWPFPIFFCNCHSRRQNVLFYSVVCIYNTISTFITVAVKSNISWFYMSLCFKVTAYVKRCLHLFFYLVFYFISNIYFLRVYANRSMFSWCRICCSVFFMIPQAVKEASPLLYRTTNTGWHGNNLVQMSEYG